MGKLKLKVKKEYQTPEGVEQLQWAINNLIELGLISKEANEALEDAIRNIQH